MEIGANDYRASAKELRSLARQTRFPDIRDQLLRLDQQLRLMSSRVASKSGRRGPQLRLSCRRLNQNDPAERLREGLRLFLGLKIDAQG